MPDNKKRHPQERRAPAFSVQDEIKRDKRLRTNKKVREARGMANKLFGIVFGCVAAIFCLAIIIFAIMRVETVNVSGNVRYAPEEIIEAADVSGAILPFVSREKIEKNIIAAYPYVNSVELVKSYPSTLEIVITEAEAVFSVNVRGKEYALDKDLRVIDTAGGEELIELILPEISLVVEGKKIVLDDKVYEELIPEILDSFLSDANALPLTKLDLSSRFYISGSIKDEVKIIFGSYENIPMKLRQASIYIEKARLDKSARTLVDVSPLDNGGDPSVNRDYEGDI